ncbi:hypothetical protein EJD96_16055 [Herbaspirillum seropedicae]|nr:hypothetical protein EJD96_16055 [Herbaspirillum seropedicae]
MRLLEYIKTLPRGEREQFAARCGTSFEYLRQVAYGNRPCREFLAINIERESGQVVRCEELCPEGVDWAYIRGAIPTKAASC